MCTSPPPEGLHRGLPVGEAARVVPAGPGEPDSAARPGTRPPRRWGQALFRHLSFRLFLVLFGSLALLLALHTGLVARDQTRQLTDAVLLSADRLGDVIQRSTRAAMLRNQRSELHEMIENIGSEPGMEGVRVYNKQGDIMFSTAKTEIGERVDLHAEACITCHADGTPRPTLVRADRARVFSAADGHRVLGLIRPIPNAPDCSSAACHAHSPEQTLLGVLDVRMSLAPIDAQLAGTRRRMLWASVGLGLAVALAFGLTIRRLVQLPVGKLIEGTRAVSEGRLDHAIDVRTGSDLGTLAASFNQMTAALRGAEAENRTWQATLEDKVRQKSEELQRAHAHLVRMDRMASLGKLAATVAHEINNPLAGILTYARLLERDLGEVPSSPEASASLQRYVGTIAAETRRCGDIVRNLLSFARTTGAQMTPVRLHELVEASLALVQHHFDLRNIRVDRRLASGDDAVTCAPDEIRQALLAILVNAAEAMPGGGRVVVTTHLGPAEVCVAVRDRGPGIPPEVLSHIFEPFFTTKSETKGVGLGLSVVYGIMQRHGGRVEVRSRPDAGARFTLVWPRQARPAGPEHGATVGASAGGSS